MNKKLMLLVVGAMFALGLTAPLGAQELNLKIDDSELKSSENSSHEMFEAYLGGGFYSFEKVDTTMNNGSFQWVRARIIPVRLSHLKLGVSVYGAQGSGESENRDNRGVHHPWEYQWSEWAVGLVIKHDWDGGDVTLDAGMGKHTDKGGVTIDPAGVGSGGRYESDHTDDLLALAGNMSFYGRRNVGKNFFPRIEFDANYYKASNPDFNESWKDNNPDPKWSWDGVNPDPSRKGAPGEASRWNVEARIWVYDLWLSENFHVTPGVVVGTGSESDDAGYTKYGVAVDVGTRRFSFLNVSCEYKDGEKEKGMSLSAWVAGKF